MHPIIEQNKTGIIELCKKHGVKELFVFGSIVRDDFGPDSDIDFLVSYNDQINALATFDTYLVLKSSLEQMLKRHIDLIEESGLENKYLRYFINKEKKQLYGEA